MNLAPKAQATLLLTSYFSKTSYEDVKPLTNAEWGRFAMWLKKKSLNPSHLLVSDPKPLLDGWQDKRVTPNLILQLLNRGHSLALAVEKWQSAGLWVLTRSDLEYPIRLKQRLINDSPPVLFGCGNKSLMNARGLAVVGSRDACEQDLKFTKLVAEKAASEGIAIVSGGARGVDITAMMGALQAGGPVIGVLADSLLRAATSAKWRKGLMDGNSVLVSPFYPEAGFSIGNAMARNKYIYCLAESSLVIHSRKKGGTINGAEENLRKSWVPLWIKPTSDKNAANADLVAKGGQWADAEIQNLKISDLLPKPPIDLLGTMDQQADLFSSPAQTDLFAPKEEELTVSEEQVLPEALGVKINNAQNLETELILTPTNSTSEPIDFYKLFIIVIERLSDSPVTIDELLDQTALHKSQLNEWLKRAIDDGVIKKLNRPKRYQLVKKKP